MKKMLKNLFGYKMAHHRFHGRMLRRAHALHRGRAMLLLGGLALIAEMWRRRHHSTEELPQLAE